MLLCRLTSRILNPLAPRRAALAKNLDRSESLQSHKSGQLVCYVLTWITRVLTTEPHRSATPLGLTAFCSADTIVQICMRTLAYRPTGDAGVMLHGFGAIESQFPLHPNSRGFRDFP
jgi:hypothetical protein